MKHSLLIAVLMLSLDALAGPWISSGGDFLKDARNPWFIFNTPQIKYCVSIDHSSSSATIENVRVAIKKSLLFWQKEFADNRSTDVANSTTLPLTIPKFIEIPCDGTEDLAILSGEGSLSPDQKKFLQKTHPDAIAAAIRTDYDPVILKGKGFIYLEGDKGKKNWVDHPWTEIPRLSAVLAHELGHVFGVPHLEGDYIIISGQVNSPVNLNLMSENLPLAAVMESTSIGFQFANGISPILSSMKYFESCNVSTAALNWLMEKNSYKCLKIVMSDLHLPSNKFMSIYGVDHKNNVTLLGSIITKGLANPLIHSKFNIITRLWITDRQTVFKGIKETDFKNTIDGGTQTYATLNLNFQSESNPKILKPIMVVMDPTQLSLMGIANQSFITIFANNRTRPMF